ncbi:hypothetical protein [Streptomyces sp. NPDC087317]|uniref:hypothetical protein n=1 Tax=Streptomyces sp. NPDC087317 TaxID=3365784 RepID=UPI0037FEFA0B
MTPADELHTAAATMRALPGPAAEPIARLLDALASSAHDEGAPIADAALAAARAINGTQLAAATASRRAPLPHAERLDRFAQVIYEHWNPDRQWKDAHPDDQVAYRADAVVAIKAADTVAGVPYALPLRTDVYREVADRLSFYTELERAKAAGIAEIPDTVRRWAEQVEAEPAATDAQHMLTRMQADAVTHDHGHLLRLIARWSASSEGRDVLVQDLIEAGYRLPHACGHCEGIDPDTCLKNPDRTAAGTRQDGEAR